jgi:phosphoribosylaminoimidazole-succinocarboxamide synthase
MEETIHKGEKLYEGKAKIVYATDDPDLVIQHFKDSATAFDGKKKGTIKDKGAVNAQVSSKLFGLLEKAGIKTHFKELLNEREMLIEKLDMIPVEAIVRNVAAGSLSKRLGYEEGRALKKPIIEFYYKDDSLGDPMITHAHALELGVVSELDLDKIEILTYRINEVLRPFFAGRGLDLIDSKFEFGLKGGEVVLGDEISADTCRFWDIETRERLDKDRFRRDLGKVEEAYEEVLRRVMGEE